MSVTYDPERRLFYLENGCCSFVLWIDPTDRVQQIYFGAPIGRDLAAALAPIEGNVHTVRLPLPDGTFTDPSLQPYALHTLWGGDFYEPTLLPVFSDGSRRFDARFRAHRILAQKPALEGLPSCRGGETLEIDAEARGLTVTLRFTVDENTPTVLISATVKNGGDAPVFLRRAFGFALHLPAADYEVLHLHGYTRRERMVERSELPHGTFSVQSRRGLSSATANPFLAVLRRGATETSGEVYGVNLVYSGSFHLLAERCPNETVRVTGGVGDCDFSWKLEPGEAFTTPEAVLCYSDRGIGGMSRAFHTLYRERLLPPQFAFAPHPVVVNNWEGTRFDCRAERLYAIADAAAGRGIDTFVLDDGWFGKRDDASSGLGDWTVNDEKIGGLAALIDYVHARGMRFGLWFEPEMVSPDSDLYRAHPDWALQTPGQTPLLGREQLMLDLTRKEVRDYVVSAVGSILDTYGIDYVKWDCNRDMSEGLSLSLPPDRRSETPHRWVLGLYDLFERIVAAHPKIFFEGCASGGSRFDPGVLHWFPQIWASDNADVYGRERIQYGTSLCYPLSSISCHVARAPGRNGSHFVPWHVRAELAQFGPTGYEMDLSAAAPEDLAGIPAETEEYRAMEQTMLRGDVYRLFSPFDTGYFGMQIVSEDRRTSKLTVIREIFQVKQPHPRLFPEGLEPEWDYLVPELGHTCKGKTWMRFGIPMTFPERDFESFVLHFFAK